MRFPDWYLKQLRERVSIADYAGKRVVWDRRKTRPSAGDYWAPCPFHTERSASFHVRDREGVFKCFGCGEGGDVFKLCQKLEGLEFGEAVQRLGAEAGLPPPDATPAAKAASDRRTILFRAVAAAQAFFQAALERPDGRFARQYLDGRGVGPEERQRFALGFAPDGWTSLADHLAAAGFSRQVAVEAGLVKEGGRSGVIDVFRRRIIFPIADAQGRTIAFGGRALDPDEPAKYLNSPETPLFHKGATLYRLKEARETLARRREDGLIVAEGYFDVMAFERAGLPAVAPLGTALTPEQLALLWRSGPAPLLCFDGDAAGQRAAQRGLELALPELGPQRTLKLITLPEKMDPDDVLRASGPEALKELVGAARSAVEAIFAFEASARPMQTPEDRADLKRRLAALAGRIKDEETKRQYQQAFNDRAFSLFAPPARRGKAPRGEPAAAQSPTEQLKALSKVHRNAAMELMVRAPLDYPELLERGGDLFAAVPIEDRELDTIRHAILDVWSSTKKVDREALSHHLHAAGLESARARVLLWPPAASRKRGLGAPGGRVEGAPSANSAGSAGFGATRSGAGELTAEDAAEIEAEWMAFLTLDATRPHVRDEVFAARACDLDEDDAAFAAAEAALRSRRSLEESALRRSGSTAPTDAP